MGATGSRVDEARCPEHQKGPEEARVLRRNEAVDLDDYRHIGEPCFWTIIR